jgi:hypothetical protein
MQCWKDEPALPIRAGHFLEGAAVENAFCDQYGMTWDRQSIYPVGGVVRARQPSVRVSIKFAPARPDGPDLEMRQEAAKTTVSE